MYHSLCEVYNKPRDHEFSSAMHPVVSVESHISPVTRVLSLTEEIPESTVFFHYLIVAVSEL